MGPKTKTATRPRNPTASSNCGTRQLLLPRPGEARAVGPGGERISALLSRGRAHSGSRVARASATAARRRRPVGWRLRQEPQDEIRQERRQRRLQFPGGRRPVQGQGAKDGQGIGSPEWGLPGAEPVEDAAETEQVGLRARRLALGLLGAM